MPTVNYNFAPNQQVWVIQETPCQVSNRTVVSVESGTVIRVRIEDLITGTDIQYDIRLSGSSGTESFPESEVFVDLAAAMAEYETRII